MMDKLDRIMQEIQELKPAIKLMVMAMMALSAMIGMVILYGLSPEPKAVTYCTPTQTDKPYCITGSVSDVRAVMPYLEINFTKLQDQMMEERPAIIVHDCPNTGSDAPPTCPPCPTPTTIPCPPPSCPTCQICEVCPRIDYQDISTSRPTLENSAYQKGFFDMKRICMVDTGQKPSKFSEAPTSGAPGFLQGGDTSLVCFHWLIQNHAFPLNYTTWNVRNESGQGRWYVWEKERNTSAIAAFRDEARYNETKNKTEGDE